MNRAYRAEMTIQNTVELAKEAAVYASIRESGCGGKINVVQMRLHGETIIVTEYSKMVSQLWIIHQTSLLSKRLQLIDEFSRLFDEDRDTWFTKNFVMGDWEEVFIIPPAAPVSERGYVPLPVPSVLRQRRNQNNLFMW